MPVFWQKATLTFQAYDLQEGCAKRRFALLFQEVNSAGQPLFPCHLWDKQAKLQASPRGVLQSPAGNVRTVTSGQHMWSSFVG